jgi:hypothetical protein
LLSTNRTWLALSGLFSLAFRAQPAHPGWALAGFVIWTGSVRETGESKTGANQLKRPYVIIFMNFPFFFVDAGPPSGEIGCRIVRLQGLIAFNRLPNCQADCCRRLTRDREKATVVGSNDQLRLQKEGLLVLDHTDEKKPVHLTYAPDRKGIDAALLQPQLGESAGLVRSIDGQGDFFRTGNPNHANLARGCVSRLGRTAGRDEHQASVRFAPMAPSALRGSRLQRVEIGRVNPIPRLCGHRVHRFGHRLCGRRVHWFGHRLRTGREKEQRTI